MIQYQTSEQPQARTTFFNSLSIELTSAINFQLQIINDIQSKLHEILNRRTPDKPEVISKEETKLGDASDNIMQNINKLQHNNAALERALKHLSEII